MTGADEDAFTQNCQLSCLGVDVGDFFDRTPFARSPVSGGNNAAIGTLTELLDELVLGVDDKGRVKRAKAMSLHYRGRQG